MDPTFPRTGPRSTNREPWAKVPTRETLLEAIRYAVNRGVADAARDESLSRVEDHADPTWLDRATEIVTNLPEGAEFTTDFVWDHLGDLEAETHEPRALGAVMRRLAGLGIIHKTGSYRPSARRECHARPIPVWRRSNGG